MERAKQQPKHGRTPRRGRRTLFLVLALQGFFAATALAGGPRFVSGSGLWIQPGKAEGWNATQLLYYTDPGTLGSSVSHAQADAMVAAAAAVWNVPTSSLSLLQGGQLAEHVSGVNSYLNGTDLVLPADVEVSNEAVIPVAVIYDTDGSVTDLLLGSGASEPLSCRQNAVTQSVDDVQPDGYIHHAMVVLNGRCLGSAPEQLTQMQYQLARAFGRVLGVAWSQNNDNVFTAVSQVTADQETYWPLMHPLDVICGTYTYQCMSNPFTLRPDDLSGLAALYPILSNNIPAGKEASGAGSAWLIVTASFPTGQGMDWLNFTARRQQYGVAEDYEIVSGVTGAYFQQALSSPVTLTQAANAGTSSTYYEGAVLMRVVPVGGLSNIFMTSEPINPLYSGEYALAPYARPPVTPSGSAQTWVDWSALPAPDDLNGGSSTAPDAASSCSPGNDGTETAPAPLDPSGWQTGLLCGWGHSSWWSATVRAGRTWAMEVTATDETGAASTNKAQPVVGIWNATDPTGSLPTVASAAVPFNSMAYGVTQMQMTSSESDLSMRFVVGDEFGGGRPDFTYTARLLYADSVSPASIGSGGGTITITGTGFRQGNVVEVNGAAAVVQSWSPTQIVAVAPAATLAAARIGKPVVVSVTDTMTNGSTSILNALTYTKAPDLIKLISAPAALQTGITAAVQFSVEVLASDGVTPVTGATVQFAVSGGGASLVACGTATNCAATANSNGVVETAVTGGQPGEVTLTATEVAGDASVQTVLQVTAPVLAASFSSTAQYLAAGASGLWTLQLSALQDGAPTASAPVSWNVSSGLSLAAAASVTGASGTAQAEVNGGTVLAGSVSTLTGCAWTAECAIWTLYGVDPSEWQVAVAGGAGQSIAQKQTLGPVALLVTDNSGHALQGAPVMLYQRVLAWQGTCPLPNPCPAAAVLASSQATVVSDANGTVSFAPLQVAGVPQTVEIAASTGTQGFVTLTLVKTPVAGSAD